MVSFVNAKLNIGLNIVKRRPDGYHDLETVFIPVGGVPRDGESALCDVLEVNPSEETEFVFTGSLPDCDPEAQLVTRAYRAFVQAFGRSLPAYIHLEKHLPFGAGMGGGSADAAFTLRMLNDLAGSPFSDARLAEIALTIGADTPFFIYNRPSFAEGVGEMLSPLPSLDEKLKGKWFLIVKPEVNISTREAFANITPKRPEIDLREAVKRPIEEWKSLITNDFEDSLFPSHPILAQTKEMLYEEGAEFALMTGSGSALYGIFNENCLPDTLSCAKERLLNKLIDVSTCFLIKY